MPVPECINCLECGNRLRWIVLMIFCCFSAQAQHPLIDDYFLFDTPEHVRVNDFVQDSSGLMWLATRKGLYHFNGQGDLTAIQKGQEQAASAVAIVQGVVYAGYADGKIGWVSNDTLKNLIIRNVAPGAAIHALTADVNGVIWAGTDEGLFAIVCNQGFLIDRSKGLSSNSIHSIAPAPDGSLAVGTDKGVDLITYNTGALKISHLNLPSDLSAQSIAVVRIAPDGEYLWTGTHEGGITRVNLKHADPPSGQLRFVGKWDWGQVNDLIVLSPDHIFVATEKYLLNVNVHDTIAITPYFFDKRSFLRLLYSKSGNLWSATASGLSSMSTGFLELIDMQPPYSVRGLTAMACDKMNNIWLAEKENLYMMPLSGGVKPSLVYSLPARISSLYVDDSNTIWIGTASRGLLNLHNGQLHTTGNANEGGPDTGNIISISGRNDNLWVSTLSGVYQLTIDSTGQRTTRHFTKEDIGSNYVYQLYQDHRNRIWMATDGAGVCMYDGRQFYHWDTIPELTNKVVLSIAEDAHGYIWAGSLSNGVFRYDGKNWRQFTSENGLQDMNITSVINNGSGQVVIINRAGVDQWYPGSFQFRHFNSNTGPSIDSVSNLPNIGAKDHFGNVYIPAFSGLLVFKNITHKLELKPYIRIIKVGVYLKAVQLGQREFKWNQNHISFQYQGTNFANIERLHYRYMLEGYNAEWANAPEESLSFPQLAPGNYNFRIQASLDKDFEEAVEAHYSFSVTAPFWTKLWFGILMAALLLLGFFVYTRLRIRGIKRTARMQQEKMYHEYEHLRSQVNPHFLFNSLNTLASLIDDKNTEALEYTMQLSDFYRNLLTYRERNLIPLGEELELLAAYIHIQKTRFGDALQLQVDILTDTQNERSIAPLALQLLVENAIKHNVVSKAVPLFINITAKETELMVSNRLQPKIEKESGTGIGIENIRQRYSLLTKRNLSFGIEGDSYVVRLPLL
jgi:ligand-binding sensor domain-containing protein